MTRLWMIPVGGALLAPLVTWLPMLAHRVPGLGLPPYEGGQGIDTWHMQVLWFVVFALVAVIIGGQDRWLGVAVLMLGISLLGWGGAFDVTHRLVFLFGALTLWAMRRIPTQHHGVVLALLAASGIFQAVYVIQQLLGYDLLWGPLVSGLPLKPKLQLIGTLGTVDAVSAYIAITAPLMPVWALPLAVAAVLKGHSFGAIAALTVGLLVQYHQTWRLTLLLTTLFAAFAAWASIHWQSTVPVTVSARLAVWRFAVADWWSPHTLPGYQIANPITGAGTWTPRIPMLQLLHNARPSGEVFVEAHNEYLQWLYETGALGFSIFLLWLGAHRRMFLHATAGAALCALAVVSGSFFTFHVVSVALLALVLVGLATPAHESYSLGGV